MRRMLKKSNYLHWSTCLHLWTTWLILVASVHCHDQLVLRTRSLRVPRGSFVYLQPEDIVLNTVQGVRCKIAVDSDTPAAIRVGEVHPKVFDCHFQRDSVTYVHNGNPLVHTDLIRLVIYYFDAMETVTQVVHLSVSVDSSNHLIFADILALKPVIVEGRSGLSNVIDSSVLRFKYAFFNETSCTVSTYEPGYQSQSLLTGALVTSDAVSLSNLPIDCRDFLSTGLRYKHNGVSSVADDYILLRAEVEESIDGSLKQTSESLFLPVHILSGVKNSPPKLSTKTSNIPHTDQFALLVLLPDFIWFVDAETPAKNLIVNISKPVLHEEDGFFVHIRDQWKPIRAFSQDDLANRRVAYHPPSVVLVSQRTVEIQLTAIDGHFLHSQPVSLHLSVSPVRTTAPKVARNEGLTVIRGQSRPLTLQNLLVIDSDNIDEVEIHVHGGPHHGNLTVSGHASMQFRVVDMERGDVVYTHNGGNAANDKMVLRITDQKSTSRIRLVITVLPDGELPLALLTNRSLESNTNEYIPITPQHLGASHHHILNNDVIFDMRSYPRFGEILKLHHPLSAGYPTSLFSQKDLEKERIWFRRTAAEHVDATDTFTFALYVRGTSSANTTEQLHSFEIKIRPFHMNLSPHPARGATLNMELNETEVARITRSMLQFEDPERPSDSVSYSVVCSPFFSDNPLTLDAGRLIAVDDSMPLTKGTNSPTIRSFIQTMVDRRMLAYIPPMEDIGPDVVQVQFIFSVSDQLRNTARNQHFNITILPVNNQIPQMTIQPVRVREGGSVLLNSKVIAVSDLDTKSSDLVLTLEQEPKYGLILNEDHKLQEGGHFGVEDLSRSSLRYMHQGSENTLDAFVVSVSDGVQKLSKSIPVTVVLLSKSSPHQSSTSPTVIRVEEGKEVTIEVEDLLSQRAEGSRNTSALIYEIIRSPEFGQIRVNGIVPDHFLNADLVEGTVRYCHTGGEIGPEVKRDSAMLMVSEDGPSRDYFLIELSFVISPVDNAPPQLMLGSPLLVGEGKSARLTSEVVSAWDQDSSDSRLFFVVSQTPVWGSLMKTRSARSERSNTKHSISSFTMSDLRDGAVQYVQSNFPEGGPPSDSFFIYATDGKQNSTPGKVEVTVMRNSKEEQPSPLSFEIDDIVVDEGGEKVFNIRLSRAAVKSKAELVLSLATPPSNGQVILVTSAHQNNGIKEVPLQEVAVSNLLAGIQLVYQHDGSETSSDQFVLSLTTGSHTVRKVGHVLVVPVNDARPEVVFNNILRVNFGASGIISNLFLKAVDADNPDNQVKYILVSPPRKGVLEFRRSNLTSGGAWQELTTGDSFTQWDINSDHLRYTHTRSLGELARDNFVFQLTDSKNFVSHETFEIEIMRPDSETIIVHNNEMIIKVGSSNPITSDLLSVIDSNVFSENIQYRITRLPTMGFVEVYNNITVSLVPISMFSQSELDRRAVFYRHALNSTSKNDSFEFVVTGARNETISSGTFRIRIQPNSFFPPTLEANVPLMVIHGSSALLTSSNLRMSGQEISSQNLLYTVVELPRHGKLLKNETVVAQFTQRDLDDGSILYKSNSTDESMMDYFLFTISSRPADLRPSVNFTETRPQFFSILIQPISKIAPTLSHVRSLVSLVALPGDRYGFILTNEHLMSTHLLFDASQIVYYIREKPKSGCFENRGTKRVIKKKFTQKDVDDERVVFVLNNEIQTTNDSVSFKITDPNRNTVDGIRLEMHWSVIEWTQSQYIVCEDINLLPIVIRRRGLTNQSSTVQVRAKQVSAKEIEDYIPRSNSTIVFRPGVTKVSWMVEIVNDGRKEGKEQKFKVMLRNTTNAILGSIDKTIIQLIDFENGQCPEYIGMISKNKQDSTSTGVHTSSPHNASKTRFESATLFGMLDRNSESNEEYDYDDYFDRVADTIPTLLESDLSFYVGGSQEETPKTTNTEQGTRRKSSSNKDNSRSRGGHGKTSLPQKSGSRSDGAKSSSNQKSRNKVNIPQPCTQETKGLLYLNQSTSKLFRCTGDQWQLWEWGRSNGARARTMLRDSTAEPDGEMLKMENFMPFLQESQKSFCPAGWTSYNNACFMASSVRLTWVEAEAACQKDGGHLTHIQSLNHLTWLWSLNDQSQFWIGLQKSNEGPTWQYTDSSPFRYYNWRANHPCTKCRFSQCISVGHRMEFMSRSCDNIKMKYICVQSPRPPRAPTHRRRSPGARH